MGDIFGKQAAREQAAATTKAADRQAANDTLVAQAAAQSQSTMIAQKRASSDAADLLSKPQGMADVQLAPDTPAAEIDPTSGRRRTTRSSFQSTPSSGTGIKL